MDYTKWVDKLCFSHHLNWKLFFFSADASADAPAIIKYKTDLSSQKLFGNIWENYAAIGNLGAHWNFGDIFKLNCEMAHGT